MSHIDKITTKMDKNLNKPQAKEQKELAEAAENSPENTSEPTPAEFYGQKLEEIIN